MLPFFSNSFLAFAGKTEMKGISFDQMAVFISSYRRKKFRTQTRIHGDLSEGLTVDKELLGGESEVIEGNLTLNGSRIRWIESQSLQTTLLERCRSHHMSLEEIFAPCRAWVDYLQSFATTVDNVQMLDGRFIDCVFSNVYLTSGEVTIVDEEWKWRNEIPLNVVYVRALFLFIRKLDNARNVSPRLRVSSAKQMINRIATSIDLELEDVDFRGFVDLESELQFLVVGSSKIRGSIALRWMMIDRTSFYHFGWARRILVRVVRRAIRVFKRLGRSTYGRIRGQ
jgi:hypothetical protein